MLLAHDWSGLGASTRAFADRVAAPDATCFALDVYGKGVRGDPLGDNSRLMAPLLEDRALLQRRLLVALGAAKRHPSLDPARIVTLGPCFGGLCSLDLARSGDPAVRGARDRMTGLRLGGASRERSTWKHRSL